MIVDAVLAKIFGTKNEREVKAMLPVVAQIGRRSTPRHPWSMSF